MTGLPCFCVLDICAYVKVGCPCMWLCLQMLFCCMLKVMKCYAQPCKLKQRHCCMALCTRERSMS